MSTRWQTKRDAAATWTSNDPVLLNGEIGFETDTGYFKIGDGSTVWSSLLYAVGVGLTAIEALAKTNGNIIVGNGSTWVAESGATARTSLGLTIGTNVLAYDAGVQNLAGVAMAADKFYYTSADNVHVAGDVTAFARSILDDADEATFKATVNLEIGTDVQAYDAGLSSIAALTYASDSFIKVTAEDTYAIRTLSEVRTDLGLVIGTDVQAQGAILDDLNTLGANSADSEFLVGTGAGALAWESGATLRTSIGVGTGDSPTFTGLTVTGCAVLGLNSIALQPATDSATFLTISDADGGTAILTVNSISENIGVGTAPNGSMAAPLQVEGNLAVGDIAAGGVFTQTFVRSASGEVPAGVLFTAENFGAATNENLSLGASFNRGTAGAKVGLYYYRSAAPVGWKSGVEVANAAGYSDLLLMKGGGNVGIGDAAPGEKLDVAGNTNVTGVYKVDDVQVVSNQGAAVADATDAATTMARLNDLLAICRTHGLIAT